MMANRIPFTLEKFNIEVGTKPAPKASDSGYAIPKVDKCSMVAAEISTGSGLLKKLLVIKPPTNAPITKCKTPEFIFDIDIEKLVALACSSCRTKGLEASGNAKTTPHPNENGHC
jgi:hypothetical protein